MTPGTLNHDPLIIWPYYTGRNKGPICDDDGAILTFYSEGHAWKHIFTVVQPGDDRACTNYQVVHLSEYRNNPTA